MCIAECPERKGTAGNQEGCTIANVWTGAAEEHDVSRHHQRRANDEEDHASVKAPAEEREEDRKEGTHDIWWDGVQLLGDSTVVRVYRFHNGCKLYLFYN